MVKLKRSFAFFLVFATLLSLAAICVSAKDIANVAAGEGVIISIDNYSPYEYWFHKGHSAKVHPGFVTSDDYSLGSPRHGADGNTLWVYCLEFQVDGMTAAKRYAAPPASTTNAIWKGLSDEQRLGITLATLYGYPMSGGNADDAFAATQCIIWEFQTGVRTSTKTNSRRAVNYTFTDGGVTKTMPLAENYFYNILATRSGGVTAYNTLISKIYNHFKAPSFAGSKIELSYDSASGKYKKTLSDTNGVLSSFNVACDSGVSCSVSGNTLTLTSSNYVSGANLTLTKKSVATTSQPLMILDPDVGQTMLTGQANVPVNFSYKVYAEKRGDLKVLKIDSTTEKGIPGAKFDLYDKGGNYITSETTGADGVAEFKGLICGSYYAVESLAPVGYLLSDETFSFDIQENGQVATWKCADENLMRNFSVYKKGEVLTGFSVDGTCFKPIYEEQYLEGAKVGIYAGEDIYTSDGTRRFEKDELIETLTTSSLGPVSTCDLFEGVYYAKELSAPEGFVLGDASPVEVCLFSNDLSVGLHNERQKCSLTFEKRFDDGSHDFSAVTFGLYNTSPILDLPADSLLEVIRPSADGTCTMTCDLPCGYSYYIKELSTAPGYAMPDTRYNFAFAPMSDDKAVHLVELDPITNVKIEVLTESNDKAPSTGDAHADAVRFYVISAIEALGLLIVLIVRKKKLTLYY